MKRICDECHVRPARFFSKKRRRFRADKRHTLCIRCYEKQMTAYQPKPVKVAA